MIHYLVPESQQSGIREYLEGWGRAVSRRMRIVPYESLPDSVRLESGTYVLSALEQLGPAMLELVVELHRQLHDSQGYRFLNHPVRTLRRFELLSELYRLGLNTFGVVGATGDLNTVRYPVFLRAERSHDGAVSPLLGSPREVEAAIARAALRGRHPDDLLVVEFCPTADASGCFRKYAAYVLGDRIVPRHLAHGPSWMVKLPASEYSTAMLEEERDYVTRNPHETELAKIRDIAGVGYGRIDYAIREDRVQTWEINLNPVIGTPWNPADGRLVEIERRRRPVQETFYAAFEAAWEAVDQAPGAQPAVRLDVDLALRRAAKVEARRPRQPPRDVGRWLDPMRSMIEPVAAPILPWLGRLARRRTRGDAAISR